MADHSIQVWVLKFLCFLFLLPANTATEDTLGQGESLRDDKGGKLTSGRFTLHFFSPNGSKKRYLGISYEVTDFTRVVWVANRNNPLTDPTGVVNVSAQGKLTLYQESTSKIVWSTPNSSSRSSVVVQLSDTGNLVISEPGNGETVWESFLDPTDTLLPNQRIGVDRFLTSWKSESDPSSGEFTYRMRHGSGGSSEMYLTAGNGSILYRPGPWDATRESFSGNPKLLEASNDFNFEFLSGRNGSYSFSVRNVDKYSISWLVMLPTGQIQRNATLKDGTVIRLWTRSSNYCDDYNRCGENAWCRNGSRCECLPGFRERSTNARGCERESAVSCGGSSRFEGLSFVKLPDTANATVDQGVRDGECEAKCRDDCACTAYANVRVTKLTDGDCIRWSGALLDVRDFVGIVHPDQLFLKQPADKKRSKSVVIAALVVCIIVAILLALLGTLLWRRSASQPVIESETGLVHSIRNEHEWGEEFSLFDFDTVVAATRNFTDKIGEGGFAVVYKGTTEDGFVFAVKRFSKMISDDGMDGFLNEARLIARLQHRNLVRLLGCCTDGGGERMLIYEYMSNGSLDKFIFDEAQRPVLHWETRAKIIQGVSKGLLYLHEDSRLKVIHRDIKAANVLLDSEMNPKISDFGTARIIMLDQSEDKTLNVIGTRGYISPEYAMDGTFSVKSDVFSFGVLMLEIISGMKNSKVTNARVASGEVQDKNLLALAWRLWKNGDGLKLLDDMIPNSNPKQVQRYINIALLCVQESADDRPTMSEVNSLLSSEEKNLSEPHRPGIYQGRFTTAAHHQSTGSEIVTVTVIEGR